MPLYEYQCHGCGKKFEVIQKFSDEPLSTHPDCGGAVERLISAPAFHLKGSGWYVTDYAKGGSSAPAKGADGKSTESASSDSKSGDSSSSESKSEAKPATSETKTESKPTPAPTGPTTT